MGKTAIYLDYAAATPVDPRVLEAMLSYFSEEFGNPSGLYAIAQHARKAVDESRATIAGILHAKSQEIIFTSSGTESDNLALLGVAKAYAQQGKHIISTTIEHAAVLRSLEHLESEGFSVTYVPCDKNGLIDPKEIERAMREDTMLVSVMYANNEIGTIQPIEEISKRVKKKKAILHTDACQAPGSLSLDVQKLGVDLMTLNGGKIYGPKGVGVLYVRKGIKITPQMHGGSQEYRMRAGTENVPAIVGMAKALELAIQEGPKEAVRLQKLRNETIETILKKISGTELNGDHKKRLPNNINIFFDGIDAATLLMRLDMAGIAVSAGSACSSGAIEPSHVLLALGYGKKRAESSIRFTIGKSTQKEHLQTAVQILEKIIHDFRAGKSPKKRS